ncbi:MAG: ShlB/FhaC/HecB family hemolysin secretion/activation protein, partial [Burkholderiaceae bacterium]|nr:ShlB/FhaC/HecB family hemolysin secretion/activation protein [Burkholderiaceae bacterium]
MLRALGLRRAGMLTPALLCMGLALPCAARAQAAAAAPPSFALLEFEVVGNTVLSVLNVERVLLPYMGEQRSLEDVEAARAALEKAYQEAGYLSVFVDVPEQRITDGVVQLQVTEGRVEALRVTGARYYDQGHIRNRVPELAAGNVPNFKRVQQQIDGLNRDERRVQPVLRPGIEPGTVEAELKVTDRLPLSGSIEINNRHPADTDPWRVQASLRYDNLFQLDHSIAFSLVTAPRDPSQTSLIALNYNAPLADGWSALGFLTLSNSAVEPLGATLVLGDGLIVGARMLRNVAAAGGFHTLAFGVDYKDLKEDVQAGSDVVSTPLRYWPWQASYTGFWPDGNNSWSLTTSIVASVRGFGQIDIPCPGNVPDVDQFACKRQGADGGFAYWRGDLRHTRRLDAMPGEWGLRLGWQLATQPLVPAEQFAVGGLESVRGYLEAAASGDSGLLGSVEWRSP